MGEDRRLQDGTADELNLTRAAARLHLVGSTPSSRYLASLRAFVTDLGLQGAVRITDGRLRSSSSARTALVSLHGTGPLLDGSGVRRAG